MTELSSSYDQIIIIIDISRKDVRLPVQLQRAMAAEAEAAREARAKVIKMIETVVKIIMKSMVMNMIKAILMIVMNMLVIIMMRTLVEMIKMMMMMIIIMTVIMTVIMMMMMIK